MPDDESRTQASLIRIKGNTQFTCEGEGVGVSDDEEGGCEDWAGGTLVGDASGVEVGADLVCEGVVFDVGVSDELLSRGRTQLPARSKPRRQLPEEDGEGDEGGEVGWGVVTAGESEEVAGSEEDGGEEDGLLPGVGVEGGSVVEGGSDEEGVVGCGGSGVDEASVVEGLVGEVGGGDGEELPVGEPPGSGEKRTEVTVREGDDEVALR